MKVQGVFIFLLKYVHVLQRFIKKAVGSYDLAVNWAHQNYFEVDALMDPTVYNTDSNVRVYELTGPVVPTATRDAMAPSSDSQGMFFILNYFT